ncbi:sugar phosphate nucleotidyltransferase [Cohnella fermenti]|uniref:Cupin domain-containing protein n=1 Tax=Cohnella fermenti TaxID=2565925 RepID=A0A4V3WE35_9BACL|nr:sugar phosphate nucleotidyltransferase [Cohnella fermenti]THF74699.1 cupin domain-containing protein [Cohnella fermenti]
MRVVLLSGGSGKRLWPLSNDMRSKQFLPLLKDENDFPESMVQRVWRQLEEAGFTDDRYIATGKSQAESILNQLGMDVPIIIEPERRDTFPAIALAASYLYSVENAALDEVVAVMPVDPYVESSFFGHIGRLESLLRQSDAQLALMGVVPHEPSENFGYIVPDKERERDAGPFPVKAFKEKPRKEEAEALIEQGALWNCGVFAFRLGELINKLLELGMPIRYDELLGHYHRLPKISFDYEVVEKLERIVALPYSGQWKDLGTWESLTHEIDAAVSGRGYVSADSANSHLINELDIPVVVIGLPEVIVAASADGILVADKAKSARIKELSDQMINTPMYVERRWGSYRTIDFIRCEDGIDVMTKRVRIRQGKGLSYQFHRHRAEMWTVLSGVGEIVLGKEIRSVGAGEVVVVPAGVEHAIRALTDLELIEVQRGSVIAEDDIVRLSMSWNDIERMILRETGVAER